MSACGYIISLDYRQEGPGFRNRWIGQSEFLKVEPGAYFQWCVVLQNVGTEPWVRGPREKQVNLGANWPFQDSTYFADEGLLFPLLYNSNRFTEQVEEYVPPGETAVFILRGRAPLTRGIVRIDAAPVIDGVIWMRDHLNRDEGIYFLIDTT